MSPRASYAVFMILALGVFLLARRLLPRSVSDLGLSWKQRGVLALAAFIGGMIGAKLPFALANESGPLTEAAWLADGKTITTGLIGAYLAVELAKLVGGIHAKTGDTFALPLAAALAIGRWGCFFNGCCFGTATTLPWGVDFGDGVRRHPTQIYESLFHLGMAGVIILCMRCGLFRWHRLKLYLIAYGLYRFLTEFIRPEPVAALALTFYQWASLALILGLSLQWLHDRQLSRSLTPSI
jgi:prolipoprotein diacylglyceryltransferase